jgi:hypothetical protein
MRQANGRDEFYSSFSSRSGSIHIFLDAGGNPTTAYPHVHAIHKDDGRVDIVASVAPNCHLWRTTLMDFPSGQQVKRAIEHAQQYTTLREIRLIRTINCLKKHCGSINHFGIDGKLYCSSIVIDGKAATQCNLYAAENDEEPCLTVGVGRIYEEFTGQFWRDTSVIFEDEYYQEDEYDDEAQDEESYNDDEDC